MRIRLLSDLHLERFDTPRDIPAIDADVVVLAGDIHSHLQGLYWAREVFPDTPIVYVAGNHEFYDADLPELLQAMRRIADGLGIHLLENDHVELMGVHFLGATLWTDFQLNGADCARLAEEAAQRQVPDYRRIDWFTQPFSPALSKQLHEQSRTWLDRLLPPALTGPTVVVTHHAPSARSIPAVYTGDTLSPSFASSCEALLERCDLWLHGHVHQPVDYRHGRARVVANPGGYPGETANFDPTLIITLNKEFS